MKKILLKIALFITLPIWAVPYLLKEIFIFTWEDISNWVERRLK